jgi:beta-glucanase (GH16 family)
MKKLGLFLTVLLVFGLMACEPSETDPVCDTDEQLIDGECVKDNEPYDERGLVNESCDHLENIDDWQPVWCDEFDYEGLPDSELWNYDSGGNGWGNRELQYYTREDLDNAFVEDDMLHIVARYQPGGANDYTSARLITKYKGDWEYGRIQIRAKVPDELGTWSALWMLPTDWEYGGWPYSGEIDIMEHVGYDDDAVHGTIHTGAYNHSLNTQIGYTKPLDTATTDFHVYEMIWEPRSIILLIDGVQFAQFGFNPFANIGVKNSDAWPFDQRFHLLMNIAVGGNWGGLQGVDSDAFPAEMVIDYVRVYQRDYAGMDQSAPNSVENLGLLDASYNSIQVSWDNAIDDVMVKEYEVYFDQVLMGTTSVNSFTATDLEPSKAYQIDVVSVDFAGNKSELTTLSVSTEGVPSITSKIEAEDYITQSGTLRDTTTDDGGGEYVGWIDDNDTLEYLLNVEEAGTYQITYRIASESNAGEIKFYGKSSLPLVTTTLPVTGAWDTWMDVTSSTFTLQEGVTQFTIRASVGGFNINYFTVEKVD